MSDTNVIDGNIQAVKVSWEKCIKINCPELNKCLRKFIPDSCLYPEPYFRIKDNTVHNATPLILKVSIIEHMFGTTTPTLRANYLALSSMYNDNASTLTNEKNRKLCSNSVSSNSGSSVTTFDFADSVTLATTITTATTITANTFSLASVTGLVVNDMIIIESVSKKTKYERHIINISGDIITIDKDIPVPVSGDKVNQQLNLAFLVAGGTSDPGTGLLLSIAKIKTEKTAVETLSFLNTITFK